MSSEVNYLNVSLLSILVLLLIYRLWLLKHQRFYHLIEKFEKIKYVKLPFLGHAYLFREGLIGLANRCIEFKDLDKPTSFWLGPKLLVWLNRPEHLRIVLANNASLDKPDDFKLFAEITLGGLVFTDGPKWKKDRRLMNGIFKRQILKSHVEIFEKQSKSFVKNLTSIEGNQFDVSMSLSDHFFKIFFETSVGFSGEKYRERFLENIDEGIELLMHRIVNPLLLLDWVFYLTKSGKHLRKIIADQKQMVSEILDRKIKQMDADAEEGKEKFMFLDYLLSFMKDGIISKEQILGELTLFMAAAYDTSTSEASFVFLMLGMHPEIQEKLYEEVMQISGPNHKSIDHNALTEMVYMDKVINETMRLFPVCSILVRMTSEELDLGDYIIPEGCIIALNVIGLHRLDRYYKNPLVFDPERFSPEEVAKRPRTAFIPFSDGPRNCIGKQFAMLSMKCLFANVIREYRIETPYKSVDSIKLKISPVLKSDGGYRITLHKRN